MYLNKNEVCFILKALVTPPYSSSVAKPLAPWPRDQGEVSELYKVRLI